MSNDSEPATVRVEPATSADLSAVRLAYADGLRMDTWTTNAALITYYPRLGFELAGKRLIVADQRPAEHYHGIELALLERPCTVNTEHLK